MTLWFVEKQFGLKARLSGILAVPLAVVQQAAVSTIPRGTLLPALQLVKLVATKGRRKFRKMTLPQCLLMSYCHRRKRYVSRQAGCCHCSYEDDTVFGIFRSQSFEVSRTHCVVVFSNGGYLVCV